MGDRANLLAFSVKYTDVFMWREITPLNQASKKGVPAPIWMIGHDSFHLYTERDDAKRINAHLLLRYQNGKNAEVPIHTTCLFSE